MASFVKQDYSFAFQKSVIHGDARANNIATLRTAGLRHKRYTLLVPKSIAAMVDFIIQAFPCSRNLMRLPWYFAPKPGKPIYSYPKYHYLL